MMALIHIVCYKIVVLSFIVCHTAAYIGSFFGNIHGPILLRTSVPFSDEEDSTQSPANGTENNILQNEGRSYLFVQEIHWCSLISHCRRSSNRELSN